MRLRHITNIDPGVRYGWLLGMKTIPEERIYSLYSLWRFLDETLAENKSRVERDDGKVWFLAGQKVPGGLVSADLRGMVF